MNIYINPSKLQCFTDKEGVNFIILTEKKIAEKIIFQEHYPYDMVRVISISAEEPLDATFWRNIPPRSHILIISPHSYFHSPKPNELGDDRQLAVMACYSTPSDEKSIQHFIYQAQETNSIAQEKLANHFFEKGSISEYLLLEDTKMEKKLIFYHSSDELVWHEQLGQLHWGEQQLLPSGEISTLPVNVFGQNIDSRLNINGELVLRGIPVLHAGSVSFLQTDQARIYDALRHLEQHAVIAKIVDGQIMKLTPTTKKSRVCADILEAMCLIDGRYEIIIEMGFGINTNLQLYPGNNAMNEVYGATNGAVHIGFGLIPFTQYHLDIICPDIVVKNDRQEVFFGYET